MTKAMDNQEEKKEQKEDQGLLHKLKDNAKKANKSKFKMWLTRMLAPVIASLFLHVILPIILVATIITCLTHILDLDGSNKIVARAASNIMQNKEIVDIAKAEGEQGYYFKIDEKVIDNYILELNKSYHEGYYTDEENDDDETENIEIEEDDDEKEEYVHDEDDLYIEPSEIADWFKTDNYEPYIIKMLRAEIASSYPKLGTYEGENEDSLGNKKDKKGNYVAQGIVQIQRTKMNKDGSTQEPIELKYIPKTEFDAMVESNSPSALDYYTFEKETIYYATYKEVRSRRSRNRKYI